jgi:hypothetical protein
MKKLIVYSLALLMLGAAFSSCSKYEEGPNFALSTKKSRLVGDWRLVKLNEYGTDIDLANYSGKVTIKKDGNYSTSTSYSLSGTLFSFESNGKWEFTNDEKTSLFFIESGGLTIRRFTILRLASKELKLIEYDSYGEKFLNYIPQ